VIRDGHPAGVGRDRGDRASRQRGEFDPALPAQAAAVVTAVYFDTLSRWLVPPEAPFDLPTALAARLDLVIAGLARR
jgi:hypothetical protein